MKKLLLSSLFVCISLTSVAQQADSVTVSPTVKILDGMTASQIIGNSVKFESEYIVYRGYPATGNHHTMIKGSHSGKIDAVTKIDGEIYFMWNHGGVAQFFKADDNEISVVTNPPKVNFNH